MTTCPLTRASTDPDWLTRAALDALARLGRCAAVALPAVRARLADPDHYVRERAANADLALRRTLPRPDGNGVIGIPLR